MFIVSSVLARVRQLAETRPSLTFTNSKIDSLISQPKRLAVEHMASNDNSYTLRGMRFGGFNTFNCWDLFENNWYANLKQAAAQRQALESKLGYASNGAVEQIQQCEALKIELADALKTVTEERQKREELEAELQDTLGIAIVERQKREKLEAGLADMVETANMERHKREALEDELKDALDIVTVERHKRKALEAKLVSVRITAGGVKQRLDEDLQRACQRRQILQLKMHDALNAAVGPNEQFEQLDFRLIDVLDEVEELKRRHLALEMAIENGHEIVEYNIGDARRAMNDMLQQWEGRWEAMQRECLAENESLPAAIQPKPAGAAQLMSPPSTPQDSSGDEFSTDQCNGSVGTGFMV
ncbi:hypothetical protein COEREDRAFT_5340 [Coemansia reversa NRRL 1564]|uniref:Uncharacterized protein n=1 Tax=Coemansia reversa (strain ATCC 12441 / NRRL 1564) TaxID=763665 RepID=A0A2G5BKH5_COERN|nr:hypothetical protein COEREDRAFT_5340 [Coemansia reversa NRRL 1564]|eukprot:PIA19510.1 hypothetical protein COEREDRAFT_5340 [Coemansia reversa NRRL 1564]